MCVNISLVTKRYLVTTNISALKKIPVVNKDIGKQVTIVIPRYKKNFNLVTKDISSPQTIRHHIYLVAKNDAQSRHQRHLVTTHNFPSPQISRCI